MARYVGGVQLPDVGAWKGTGRIGIQLQTVECHGRQFRRRLRSERSRVGHGRHVATDDMDNAIDGPVSCDAQMAPDGPLRAILRRAGDGPSALQLTGCATAPTRSPRAAAQRRPTAVEETYGIQVEGLRLSAAGSMLDFRYRVLDPQKAAPILNGKIPALPARRGARRQARRAGHARARAHPPDFAQQHDPDRSHATSSCSATRARRCKAATRWRCCWVR